MRRRDLVKGIVGSAATWPVVAVAQQPAIPVIGFLSFRSANDAADSEAAFRQGLSEIGYSDGRSVHIAFRWAEGKKDRLPVLAADLVDNLHVAVIAATGGGPSALAAKAATKTIPIVFTYGADPVKAGIVASLNRPEENITGVTWFSGDLAGKRLALLHDIVPNLATVGLLANPSDPEDSSQLADSQDAARRLNLKLVVMNASTEREIDAIRPPAATYSRTGQIAPTPPPMPAPEPNHAPLQVNRRQLRADERRLSLVGCGEARQ
jgi:putative tryptophan/tyrosine transport system substrate-binding protein